MNDTPRNEGDEDEDDGAPGSPGQPEVDLGGRVAGASAWAFGAMAGMHALKAVAQIALAFLLVREYWGIIAILRVVLTAVEMLSDVGIRGSVVYHRAGASRAFLNTAWTLQIGRGIFMWLVCCALAWPVAWWYGRPLLLWLLPICGLEAVNNGLLSVGIYSRQRVMKVGMPIFLEWIGLGVSIGASIVWALVDPSPWALAIGPLVGGTVKTVMSHILIPEVRLRLQWDWPMARDLIHFGKWIYAGTVASFIAQQFLTLYLGKMVIDSILGLYQMAWNFAAQSSKPLTLISNQVLLPLFAQGGRMSEEEHQLRVRQAIYRFLPSCLLIILGLGLFSPAFFRMFYRAEYHDAGNMSRYLAVVIWFMILQHVPRGAMLSLGNSRGVSYMMFANAAVTIVGCIGGYAVGKAVGFGSLRGAILGNALGNIGGCLAGYAMARRGGIRLGRPMLKYSLAFVGLFAGGTMLDSYLQGLHTGLNPTVTSLLVTALAVVPLAPVVWMRTVKIVLDQRRAKKAPVTAP